MMNNVVLVLLLAGLCLTLGGCSAASVSVNTTTETTGNAGERALDFPITNPVTSLEAVSDATSIHGVFRKLFPTSATQTTGEKIMEAAFKLACCYAIIVAVYPVTVAVFILACFNFYCPSCCFKTGSFPDPSKVLAVGIQVAEWAGKCAVEEITNLQQRVSKLFNIP